MAAFCNCCGAEIGPKAEACAVCGTPLHGMTGAYVARPANSLDAMFESETATHACCFQKPDMAA